jgi:hypothetical protein
VHAPTLGAHQKVGSRAVRSSLAVVPTARHSIYGRLEPLNNNFTGAYLVRVGSASTLSRMARKRLVSYSPLRLKIVTSSPALWSWPRQPSDLTSWIHCEPFGGSRFSTGADGIMKGLRLSTAQM